MLHYFSRIINRKSAWVIVCISLIVLTFSFKSNAQSLGDPIVHITFGSGVNQFAGPLKADSGFTTYTYVGYSPDDNYYTIVNSTQGLNKGWVYTTDHTGDPNGYMMIVNASFTPGVFYTRKVTGLCGSTTYQFSAFIKNILKNNDHLDRGIKPDVTFNIETTNGTILGNGFTGPMTADSTWREFNFTFATPDTTQTVILKMVNNAPGGIGNDIAIDDITFSTSGSQVTAAFDQATTSFCANAPQPIKIKATTTLDPNHYQKLQENVNGIWVDRSTGATASSFTVTSPTTAGIHYFRLVAGFKDNIDVPSCIVSSNLLTVNIFPVPAPEIILPSVLCQGVPDIFKFDLPNQDAQNIKITSAFWDFGDGQTSNSINPTHTYSGFGDFTAKLTVNSKDGCISATVSKSIHVTKAVDMAFSYSTPVCETGSVTFTDASTSADGAIVSRVWDFADSTTLVNRPDNTPFQHTFKRAGTYPIKLMITTTSGCTTTLTRNVVINPLPVVNFGLPPVCLADAFAKFTDSTKVADNSSLTYSWNFGDANATAINPNTSAQKNPQHKYIAAQPYQVTLTVTTALGCISSTTKTIMVNGAIPVANFTVLNASSLCSRREVFFSNQSTVDAGSITRVEWFFDTADLNIHEVDDHPYPGKLYRHLYPAFNSPPARNYQVRMLAYSGQVCVSQKDQTIILIAGPTLTFNAPDSVCLNNGPIQFTAKEDSGIGGTSVYKGRGVRASGLFDPTIAGLGIDTIKYIYTASTACADTITRVIVVKPIPTADAGVDVTLLSGNTTRLQGKVSGNNVVYAWSPATGLSSTTVLDPVVTVGDDITYTLTVTNGMGCTVIDKISIKALKVPVIPNAFTPNHDGINDKWDIKYLGDYPGCTVDVFNRNGQKVYSSVGYAVSWDGSYNNNGDLPLGVYYYIINPKNGRKPVSGYVTIIR